MSAGSAPVCFVNPAYGQCVMKFYESLGVQVNSSPKMCCSTSLKLKETIKRDKLDTRIKVINIITNVNSGLERRHSTH